jgi:hypothetical protein
MADAASSGPDGLARTPYRPHPWGVQPMRGLINPGALVMLLGTLGMTLVGCRDDANQPAAQSAENALGVQPNKATEKTTETTSDVTVIKDTKVIDNATGKTISETKEVTPVTVTKAKEVKTDVKVKVGETKTTP